MIDLSSGLTVTRNISFCDSHFSQLYNRNKKFYRELNMIMQVKQLVGYLIHKKCSINVSGQY